MNKLCQMCYFVTCLFSIAVHTEAGTEVLASDLFQSSGTQYVKVSPNGKYLASLQLDQAGKSIEIIALADNKVKAKFSEVQTLKNASILSFYWIDDRHLCVETTDEINGFGDLIESKKKSSILFFDVTQPTAIPKVLATQGNFIHALPEEENQFLIEQPGNISNVYKIDVRLLSEQGAKRSKLDLVDGGQFKQENRVAFVDQYAISWFFDDKGRPQAVLAINAEQVISLQEIGNKGSFETLTTWDLRSWREKNKKSTQDPAEIYIPYMKANGDGNYFVVKYGERPLNSIYLENYKTHQRTKVFDSGGLNIVGLLLADDHQLLGVKLIANDRLEYRFIEETVTDFQTFNRRSTISESLNGEYRVEYSSSFNFPGKFELKRRDETKASWVGYHNDAVKNALPGEQIYQKVQVDGTEVSYFLNLPTSTEKRTYPLIVMPHGGPFGVFDSPYYDPTVQYWLTQQYAVLRINFRGSGGRGKAFEDLGKLQYGSGMLRDIEQVTRQVLGHSALDSQQVCVFGMSYGGYAAVMLGVRHPDLIRCAVSFAGISDLNLFVNERTTHGEGRKWAKEYIGDPQTQYDLLKAQSPLYQIKDLSVPVLLLHGERDKTVDVEHFYRMKLINGRLQKSIQFQSFANMGHAFESGEDALSVLNSALAFVKQHIGPGRK